MIQLKQPFTLPNLIQESFRSYLKSNEPGIPKNMPYFSFFVRNVKDKNEGSFLNFEASILLTF